MGKQERIERAHTCENMVPSVYSVEVPMGDTASTNLAHESEQTGGAVATRVCKKNLAKQAKQQPECTSPGE